MKIPDKPLKLIKFLQEKIHGGEFPGGSKLPSIRVLMEQFELSYGSVKRGIDYLAEVELVEKLPGRGVFVKQRRKPQNNTGSLLSIAVFMKGNSAEFRPGIYQTVLLGIQILAASKQISLRLNYIGAEKLTSEYFQQAIKGCQGALFLGEYDSAISNLQISIPAAGICMDNSSGGRISLVELDPFTSARQAADFFNNHDIKTVNVISGNQAAYIRRGEIFAEIWKQQGNKAALLTIPDSEKSNKKSGYLFTTGSLLQTASELHKKNTGCKLADDTVVLSMDGKCLIDPDYHLAPTISLDWESAGRYAMEECIYRINHPGSIPKRIYLPGKLVM